jgi:hypothetical protein
MGIYAPYRMLTDKHSICFLNYNLTNIIDSQTSNKGGNMSESVRLGDLVGKDLTEYSLMRGYFILDLSTTKLAIWEHDKRTIVCTSKDLLLKIMKECGFENGIVDNEIKFRIMIGPIMVHKSGSLGFTLCAVCTFDSTTMKITDEEEFQEMVNKIKVLAWSEYKYVW